MAAAHEGKTVKDFLIKLAQARIEELVRKGILQRAKGSDVFETTYYPVEISTRLNVY